MISVIMRNYANFSELQRIYFSYSYSAIANTEGNNNFTVINVKFCKTLKLSSNRRGQVISQSLCEIVQFFLQCKGYIYGAIANLEGNSNFAVIMRNPAELYLKLIFLH